MPKKAIATRSTTFDYQGVAQAKVKRCERSVEAITRYQRRMASDILLIGKELMVVKEAIGHGLFTPWIKHHFGWSDRTARRMMQAAEVFGTANLADLNIEQSALYAMSEENCPDEVRESLLEQAETEVITHAKVRQAIEDFTEDGDEDSETATASDDSDGEPYDPDEQEKLMDVVVEWSLPAFLTDLHRQINRWLAVCPQDSVEHMADALRDIAERVETSSTCVTEL